LSAFLVQLLTGLSAASSLFLVAAGLTVIFGVTRVVNFAHGSLTMLGAYLGWSIITRLPRSPECFILGVLLAAVATAIIGAVFERLLLRRIYRAPELLQLLFTFGAVLVVQDATLYLWGPNDLSLPRPPWLRGFVSVLGERVPLYDLILIAVGPLVLGLARWCGRRPRIATWWRRSAWTSGCCSPRSSRWARGSRGWGARCRCRIGRRICRWT
jgi:branched-chain amino acid transport system permease protein